MSDRKLEIDEEEVKFLLVVCSEEVERCRKEQAGIKFLQEAQLSRRRLTTAVGLVDRLADILERIYEDDGLASRPDLN